MNPKAEKFFDAITLLREDIVEEAQDYRFRKKTAVWKKFGSLAACLVLLASISLLMLPRGCGSGGSGSADMNNSSAPMASADSCAPADEPVSGDTAPEPSEAPADDPEYGQAEQRQFTAAVIEIYEDSILVEDAGEQTVVSTVSLELPELAVGDRVRVTYDEGPLLTTDPPILSTVVSIEKVENND